MVIKSLQTLVSETLKEIKTINADADKIMLFATKKPDLPKIFSTFLDVLKYSIFFIPMYVNKNVKINNPISR